MTVPGSGSDQGYPMGTTTLSLQALLVAASQCHVGRDLDPPVVRGCDNLDGLPKSRGAELGLKLFTLNIYTRTTCLQSRPRRLATSWSLLARVIVLNNEVRREGQ
jgi:hypothetical protein